MSATPNLDAYLARQPDRCPVCLFHIPTQGCACAGQRLKLSTLAAVNAAADPDVKSSLERAIRRHAASGNEFSMNDLRGEVDASGPVVGSVFGALSQARVIRHVGYTPSTKPNTKGHDIKTWIGRAA